jgi:A/G-specific adenine glycosylase
VKRISSAFATSFRSRLLSFYRAQRRALPWRATSDPYRILVSEFMLQQTRVETVKPYYDRWLQRFPDLHALADAPEQDVLKSWEGLGYYSRARNLQRAAQMVREQHDGELPADYERLRALPGVGPYTAAAVASIAFAAPHAAVDGNVKRVLCRLLDLPSPLTAELQRYADRLLDARHPGEFNQGMMELGATVCTPRQPACAACPVRRLCRAHRNGTVPLRPAHRRKAPLPEETVHTLVAFHAGKITVVQRPSQGLLAGLWEFPEVTDTANYEYLGDVTHTFTHKRVTYRVYFTTTRVRVRVRVRARVRDRARQLPPSQLQHLPMPAAQRRILHLALPLLDLESATP